MEIMPHSENEINAFEENLSQIDDPYAKILEIANFTANDYYQAYGAEPNPISYVTGIWGYTFFGDLKDPRIRSGSLFSNDPYFITYYKTGACAESAILFNYIANKSGFESRIVGTKAEDHQWNEIKINYSWIQVDPTIYYHYYHDPINNSGLKEFWFDNQQAYSILKWNGGYSKIVAVETQEDLTKKYLNTSSISIYCQNCNYISIKPDPGRSNCVEEAITNSESNFLLGCKNYTISVKRNFIPFLFVKEATSEISLEENQNLSVSLFPEKIQPTIWAQFIFLLILIVILLYSFRQFFNFCRDCNEKRKK